jgi:hypothetical protein
MTDAWQILRDFGLPTATSPSGLKRATRELGPATLAAVASAPTGRDAEALAAFVFAWQHHWPETFATELAADTTAVLEWAERNRADDNRYLKLRRIAIENLARVL